MAQFFDFSKNTDYERHECDSKREGEWLIFECPQCDYVRRYNFVTQEMKVEGGKMTVLHSGMRMPVGLQPEKLNPN